MPRMSRMSRKSHKSRKSRKAISIISNITFVVTILLAAYIFISSFLVRRSLPPGVCPIDNNRTLIYIAIGFALVTFILSFFDVKGKGKGDKSVDGAEVAGKVLDNKESSDTEHHQTGEEELINKEELIDKEEAD